MPKTAWMKRSKKGVRTAGAVRRIALVTFPDAQLLDIAGPADVFTTANTVCGKAMFEVCAVSSRGGSVTTTSGVAIDTKPIHAVAAGSVDTVIVVGGTERGILAAMDDPLLSRWVCGVVVSARRYGAVCSGAFALARWGLLEGRRATTHWSAVNLLRSRYPNVKVEPDALYVHEGRLWTSGGVSAGIDMSLAMLESDVGHAVSARVAKQLILSARRLGNQSQFSQILELQAGRYGPLVDWMRAHIRESLVVERLAAFAGESSRSFYRHFEAELGESPASFVETLRLQVAREHLEAGASVKAAARQAGMASDEQLARAFRRRFDMTPLQYKALHAR
ncbi:MAG: AraC family transcriptional regulator [Myxococcaceae bacterium]|nr:AraC family transcriptional regulator [Myxococcaceae bacterium]